MFNLKGKIKSLIASNKLADGRGWAKRFSGNKGKKKNKDLIEKEFDKKYYLEHNPDILNNNVSAIDHYILFGAKEGRNPNSYFETNFYISECGDSSVLSGEVNPLAHYIYFGRKQLINSRPIDFPHKNSTPDGYAHIVDIIEEEFDPIFYLENNQDVKSAGVDPLKHFVIDGWREGRNPNNIFDVNNYLAHNDDVKEADVNPFYHYLAQGVSEGRKLFPDFGDKLLMASGAGNKVEVCSNDAVSQQAGLNIITDEQYSHIYEVLDKEFDREYYQREHPDVVEAGLDPLYHYIVQGWVEGRSTERFSTQGYLAANKDVLDAKVNPYYHYLVAGRTEGRPIQISVNEVSSGDTGSQDLKFIIDTISPKFNSAFYLKMYPEVEAMSVDPIEHYVRDGWKNGFWPTPDFNSAYYLSDNPDVADAGVNPYFHYLVSGQNERRHPDQPGGDVANTIISTRTATEVAGSWKVNFSGELVTEEELEILLALSLSQVNYLAFSHDVYLKNLGGVQQCVAIEQQEANKQGYGYLHLAPVQPLPFMAEDEKDFLFHLSVNGMYEGAVNSELLESCFKRLSVDFKPIIHVLHGHSSEIIERLLVAVGRPHTTFWLHDYFSICEGYNLLRNNVVFCGAPSGKSTACSICVHGERREKHRYRINKLFESIEMSVIAPSQFTLDLWESKSDLKIDSSRVVEHLSLEFDSSRPDHDGGVVRIGFLGFPAYLKGWGDFAKLVREFISDDRYKFVHLAHENSNLLPIEFVEGKATFDDREAMLRAVKESRLDLVFIPAKSPETFGFTSYEAIAGGAKVLTYSDAGNVSAIVDESGFGAVFAGYSDISKLFKNGLPKALLSDRAYSRPVYSKMSLDTCER